MTSMSMAYDPEPPPPEPSFVVQELRTLGLNCLIAVGISLVLGAALFGLGNLIGPL